MKTQQFSDTAEYGFYDSPYGTACMVFQHKKLYALIFHKEKSEAFKDIKNRFKNFHLKENESECLLLGERIFRSNEIPELVLTGTEFQKSVWKALLEIPVGKTVTYTQIATAIGRPKAVRAVGTAIGANPIAILIPCHRVVRTDGNLGGYRWGIDLKKEILRNEGCIIE